MDNCKIKVTDEVSNTEIQEALFELGCEWFGSTNEVKPLANCWIDVGSNGRLTWSFHGSDEKELTLPQLRDLVVLKRNDVKDANWKTEGGDQIFKDSNDKSFIYRSDGWDELQRHEMRQAMWEKPKAIEKPQDPALISGADVPALIKKGESVQFRSVFNVQGGGEWKDLDLERDEEEFSLGDLINTRFEWRLKPQTIKLELELPKPFKPKNGEIYWFVDSTEKDGYLSVTFHDDKDDHKYVQFGAYRTEEEIKQVVEQLRKIRGTNS